MKPIFCFAAALALAACGFKGDLYLPKPGDDNHFGPIQTGLEFGKKQPEKQQEIQFKRTQPRAGQAASQPAASEPAQP